MSLSRLWSEIGGSRHAKISLKGDYGSGLSLLAHIQTALAKRGDNVFLSSNSEKLSEKSYLVLELSSWQLEGFRDEKISPQYSVITNIYSDHLNRYKSMDDYVGDKKYIYKFQNKEDVLFINVDKFYLY